MSQAKKGMVFGVFDGLHDGHRHFLREAKAQCGALVIVIATDGAVRALKGRAPKHSFTERVRALRVEYPDCTVVAGDEKAGEWHVFDEHRPEVVVLGYDQNSLAEEFRARGIPYTYASAHKPATLKSSLLNNPA